MANPDENPAGNPTARKQPPAGPFARAARDAKPSTPQTPRLRSPPRHIASSCSPHLTPSCSSLCPLRTLWLIPFHLLCYIDAHDPRRNDTETPHRRHARKRRAPPQCSPHDQVRHHLQRNRKAPQARRTRIHPAPANHGQAARSEEHTSELQSPDHLVCRLLLEKK